MMLKALVASLFLVVQAKGFTSPKPRCQIARTQLLESMLEVKMPSENEAVSLGVRDWPQQLKKGSWSETVNDGKMTCAYVLDGSASVQVTLFDEAGAPKTSLPTEHTLVPGSLLEAMGPAKLDFRVKDGFDSILLLTPDYQQGTLLAFAGTLLIVLCGVLLNGGISIGGN